MKPRREEWPLLAAIFLDLLGFGMLIPDVQLRAEALGAPGWLIGVVLASMFVVQFIASPRWGALSDRIGRKPVLVGCTLLSALAMFVYAGAGSVWLILASRVVAGLGAANVAVAQAYLADRHDDTTRAAAMGRVGAAISTGLILGPAVGGLLSEGFGQVALGAAAGSASLLGALWIAIATPHVPPREARAPGRLPLVDLRLLRDLPSVRPLVVISVVAWFSLATLEGTFGRLIKQTLGLGALEFGWIFSYESLLGVAVQGLALGWMARWSRDLPRLRVAYLAQGVGLAAMPFAPHLAGLFLASTFYAIGNAVSTPTINSLCSGLTPASRQGELFGLLQGARSLGFVLGPIAGGALFDVAPAAPYVLAGAVCALAAVLVHARASA
jgi:MFS family permease